MEKGMFLSPVEWLALLALFAFVTFNIFIGWQIVMVENGAIEDLTQYCDGKFGAGNWRMQNGYACHGVLFGGLHDCYECVNKTEG